jgi:hypothetical protein
MTATPASNQPRATQSVSLEQLDQLWERPRHQDDAARTLLLASGCPLPPPPPPPAREQIWHRPPCA